MLGDVQDASGRGISRVRIHATESPSLYPGGESIHIYIYIIIILTIMITIMIIITILIIMILLMI